MGILKKITDEYFGNDVREEDGIKVNLFGKSCVMRFNDFPILSELTEIEKGKLFVEKKFDFFDEPVYVCMTEDGMGVRGRRNSYKVYYMRENEIEISEKNILKDATLNLLCDANYNVFEDDFLVLNIVYETLKEANEYVVDFNTEFWIDDYYKDQTAYYANYIEVQNEGIYHIYKNIKDAEKDAKDKLDEELSDEYGDMMMKRQVKSFIDEHGDSWIKYDVLKDWFKETWTEHYNSMDEDDGEHGNKLNDILIERGIVSDSPKSFGVDMDKPKFYIRKYRDRLVEKTMEHDDITREKAEKKVDGYSKFEYVDSLIDFGIVDETTEFFDLDYDYRKFDYEKAVEKLVKDDISESDNLLELSLDKLKYIGEPAYDLEKLSKLIFKKDRLDIYLSKNDYDEFNCDIDGHRYYLYVTD